MEAVGLALTAAQTLLATLECSDQLKEMFSIWGCQSELESLKKTVSAVNSVLEDAESKDEQELSHQERDFIEKLKDAIYDADDLIDEFDTLARQQGHLHKEGGNKVSKKVRRIFSRLGKLSAASSMSQEIKNIRKKLDAIASDASKFCFKVDNQPLGTRMKETCSYVYEKDIIGREDDKRRIVETLLDSRLEGHLFVLTIVGMGGLGKTTLAQLVYNDERIKMEFPHQKFWVCVSDQGGSSFSVQAILANILKLVMKKPHIDHTLGLEQIFQELRYKLSQDKFLLVLDDVWTEKRSEWLELQKILLGLAPRGSKVMVTTRSKETANALASNHTYELQGLSDEDSWRLFEMTVGQEEANRHDLVKMGEDIVKKCANVPLAIKVVGSLLYGQDINTWRLFHQRRVTEMKKEDNKEDDNEIMQILKFSYYQLSRPLKNCFTYCALFPKDFEIPKKKLISLWMAQGYVKPSDEGQSSTEDVAEEYFKILVRRCFFQDVKKDFRRIEVFTVHDLMHDIAQKVAGKEIFAANSATDILNKKIRHLSDDAADSRTKGFMTRVRIRSYVQCRDYYLVPNEFPMSTLLAKWRSLRALDLSRLNIQSLPNSIGMLLHVRYLNLSGSSKLIMLPKSFTKLINLETLILEGCSSVKELPKDFNKLVKLRALEVRNSVHGPDKCALSYMPRMEKLTCLNSLDGFVVAKRESNLKQDLGGLEDLRALGKLRGSLNIWVRDNYKHAKENGGGGYLINKEHLNRICIMFPERENDEVIVGSDEGLLEDLKPHDKLKELTIDGYRGVRIPSWAIEDNLAKFLPNLVNIQLDSCDGLQSLPWFGKLRFLKRLALLSCMNLEYMESGTNSNNGYGAAAEFSSSLFFPSLEELSLWNLPKLKGWWRELSMTSLSGSGMGDDEIVNRNNNNSMRTTGVGYRLPSFPRLSQLKIWGCPDLASIPLCPTVEFLTLYYFNERLQIIVEEDSGYWRSHDPKIRKIVTTNVRHLKSLPMVAFQRLTEMRIGDDDEVESLSEVEEVFRGCSSSLRSLGITDCGNLRSVSGGLKYLTALESLEIEELPLKDLPEWIGCLPSLHSLEITNCEHLESLPEALGNLTSLITISFS